MIELNRNGKRITAREAEELLPWYVAKRLSPVESTLVERWLDETPQAGVELNHWKILRDEVAGQKPLSPSPELLPKILTLIHRQAEVKPLVLAPWLSWTLEAALTLLVLLVLWISVRPGLALEWVVTDNSLANFRVYRAPLGSDSFALIAQVSAQSGTLTYRFVDAMLTPGRSYVYRVEGVGSDEVIAVSQSVVSHPLAALPGLLAILFISLILGYCGMTLLHYWPLIRSRISNRPIPI
jgi:hypothetical protein